MPTDIQHFHLPDSGCCPHPDCVAAEDAKWRRLAAKGYREHGHNSEGDCFCRGCKAEKELKKEKKMGDGMSDSESRREAKQEAREAKRKKVENIKRIAKEITAVEEELRQNDISMRGKREQLARLNEELEKVCN